MKRLGEKDVEENRINSGGTSTREPLSVLRDEENGIATVFINCFDLDTATGKVIANTVKSVSEDFDNIIIDIRNNNGGYIEYAYDVLSTLFPKDFEVSDTVSAPKTALSETGIYLLSSATKTECTAVPKEHP